MEKELYLDFKDDRFLANKYAVIEEMRTKSFYARTKNGVAFFNQEDAMHVMRCVDFRFSFFQITPEQSAYLSKSIEHELLNQHGQDHRRLQKLVMMALREQIVEGFKDTIRGLVNDLVDEMPDRGVVDFCADFSELLPSRVLGPMLGLPYDDIPGFNDWIRVGGRKVDALRTGIGIKEVEDANRNMHDYLRNMLRERRQNIGEDVFSELIVAEIDGDRLSEDELVSLAAELASAGVDTTRAQLPLTLYELINHPDQMALLQNDPRLASSVVEEGMRYAPLPFGLPHAALTKHTYRGIEFEEGDIALVMVPAANRDPAAMKNPHQFDILRKRPRHFSFGYGPHFCTGAQIARMEMEISFEVLSQRITTWKLVEEPPRDPVTKGETPQQLLVEISKK